MSSLDFFNFFPSLSKLPNETQVLKNLYNSRKVYSYTNPRLGEHFFNPIIFPQIQWWPARCLQRKKDTQPDEGYHTYSMGNRVFIIHGWGGSPNKDWIPWAVLQLKEKGYEVSAPFMPDTDNPQIEPWVSILKEVVSIPQAGDIFIGHSIGCQTILRFLEGLEPSQKVAKVILIAPWLALTNLENDESWKIADPWLKTPIDFLNVKPRAKSFTTIFSDNDPWVPLKENSAMFKEKLDPKVIILNNKGHFSEEENVKEIPEILTLL